MHNVNYCVILLGKPVMPKNIAMTLFFLQIMPAFADNFEHQWFKVTGFWDGERLRADRIKLRDPEKSPHRGQVTAQLTGVDSEARMLNMGPFKIHWTDETSFKKIQAEQLKSGLTIKVYVEQTAAKWLIARVITRSSEAFALGSLQVVGLTGNSRQQEDGIHEFSILRIPVYTVQNGYNIFKSLTRRQDVRRPDDQFKIDLFGNPLTIGGEYNIKPSYRDNFNLSSDEPDNSVRLDQELKLEFFYPMSTFTALFLSFKVNSASRFNIDQSTSDKTRVELARDETWIYFGRIAGSGFGFQAGNQNISETREWWWDKDLDALRLYYDYGPFHFELAGGKQLGGESTQRSIRASEEGIYRLLGLGSWMWTKKQRLELFFLRQWDRSTQDRAGSLIERSARDSSDGDLVWFGGRAIGGKSLGDYGNFFYWADAAGVLGDETITEFDTVNDNLSRVNASKHHDVSGWAFDVGGYWTMPFWLQPTLTLSYARASGDSNPTDGKDSEFRQTGIQRNKWRFHGVNRFRIYGELLRPELSNLGIVTTALGFRLLYNSSVELIYHKYDQVVAAASQRRIRINADLNGKERDLGQEWDVVMNFREWKHLELELTGAVFNAGKAYGNHSGDLAYSIFFEANYNF